jgi:hypothetical protein
MKTTAKETTVRDAIGMVNLEHGYKIIFNQWSQRGKWFNFTIRSEHSGISGSRYGSDMNRRLISASWHAHGYIIDTIFELEPDSILISMGKKFTADTWYWEDRNIGSRSQPCYFSETSIL